MFSFLYHFITRYIQTLANQGMAEISVGAVSVTAIVVFVLFAVIAFVLKSVGMYCLAKNNSVRGAKLAFVPFVNFILLGRIAGEVNVFGTRIKNMGLWLFIFITASFAINSIFDVLIYYDEFYAILNSGIITEVQYPASLALIITVSQYLLSILSFACAFFVVFLSFALFNRFDREKSLIFSLILIIVYSSATFYLLFNFLLGIFLLVIRKKKAFDFQAYYAERQRREREARSFRMHEMSDDDDVFEEFSSERKSGASGLEQDVFSDFTAQGDFSRANQEKRKTDDDDDLI